MFTCDLFKKKTTHERILLPLDDKLRLKLRKHNLYAKARIFIYVFLDIIQVKIVSLIFNAILRFIV